MRVKSIFSHSLEGLLWFDLPMGLLLAFIFHNTVRDALIDNLPIFLRARFTNYKRFYWLKHFKRNWIVVIISILIGAISHILWDNATHEKGYFVQSISALSSSVDLLSRQVPIWKILQHTSTLIGRCVIVFAIYRLPVNKTEKNINWKFWLTVAGLAFIISTIRFSASFDLRQYGNVLVTVISAILISLSITPFLLKLRSSEE